MAVTHEAGDVKCGVQACVRCGCVLIDGRRLTTFMLDGTPDHNHFWKVGAFVETRGKAASVVAPQFRDQPWCDAKAPTRAADEGGGG